MLSAEDLREAIEKGWLVISPYSEKCIRPAGILLTLGHNLLRPIPGKTVDVKKNTLPDYEEIRIEDDKPFLLEPGGFILGHTYEAVTVGQNLGFLIEGRSTLARVGLTIVQTAMLVYPGHRDRAITLELANHGLNPIMLYPRMKIARAAIFRLSRPVREQYDDTGKYRNQAVVGRPIFDDEFIE